MCYQFVFQISISLIYDDLKKGENDPFSDFESAVETLWNHVGTIGETNI